MASYLTRFEPFSDLARFEPFGRLDDMFRDLQLKNAWRDLEQAGQIKVDVTENEQAYTVKAEIPGARKEDIKVDIEHNQVSIAAETRRESEQKKGDTVVRSERYYGQQYRSFTLANDIDDEKAIANYQDGVLVLTLPKRGGSTSRKVKIN